MSAHDGSVKNVNQMLAQSGNVVEYELTIDVELIRFYTNSADQLTRVPQPVCIASTEEQESTHIYKPSIDVVGILVWSATCIW